jgi:probable phosphoglycerate mutase
MTELLLIRHGETDANRELRFQGHVDLPLNDMGHEQARRVGLRLASEPIDALFCSDLQRACQTAHPVREHRPNAQTLKPIQHADLREQSFGVVDGLRVADIQLQYPQDWAQWVCFDADYSFSGGETTRQFHARVMALLHTLAQSHAGQTLAVVTHGGVLDMVYRTALGLPLSGPRQSDIPNAGLNRVRVTAVGVEIISWADTAHLAGLPPQPVYNQRKLAMPGKRDS